jgi:hypothetical protein
VPRPEFDFTIDGDQWRQSADRIGFCVGGDDFNTGQFFSDTYIDPITSTLMLRPRCFYTAWYTSNTAPYDKLGLTSFGLSAPWKEVDLTGVGGSKYLQAPTSAKGVGVLTTSSYSKNTGFYVSFFGYSEGSRTIVAEFGWNSSATLSGGTGCRLYSDGLLEVWRNGVKIEEGQVSGSKGSASNQNALIELAMIPCRHRELLIISSAGNGVRAVMEDILETDASPTITPATKFWVMMPGTVLFQVAPLKFATSGYACSELIDLAEAPPTTATLETYSNPAWATPNTARVYGDQSYRTGNTDAVVTSLTLADGTTSFVPDGVNIQLRVKATLTGNGFSTPVVYGINGGYERLTANTDDSEVANLDPAWQRMSFDVPETGGSTISWDMFNPARCGIVGLYAHANKPTLAYLGDTIFHEGMSEPVEYVEGTNPDNDRITLKSQPHITQLLKDYCFRERMVFDGMLICHASQDCIVRRLVHLVGGSDFDLNLETSTIRAGEIAPAVCGDFNEVADIGENAWDYLCRVMQDYLGGWWYGEVPVVDTGAPNTQIKFTTKSPATINGGAVKYVWYATIDDAITAGISSSDAWRHVYRQHRWHYIKPEANEIVVTGFDSRIQKPVQTIKSDFASIDPSLAPSLRPSNWLGQVKRLALINKGIASQDLADSGAQILYDRCTPYREIREIEVELPIINDATGLPVWVTDKVTLGDAGDFIVVSISGAVEKDPDGADQWMWRPCTYVLANIVGYSNSSKFDDIVAFSTMNGIRNTLARRGFVEGSITRLPIYTRNVL